MQTKTKNKIKLLIVVSFIISAVLLFAPLPAFAGNTENVKPSERTEWGVNCKIIDLQFAHNKECGSIISSEKLQSCLIRVALEVEAKYTILDAVWKKRGSK